jgi:asparagine synthase (glutamine-hydrolysing)
MDEQWAGYLTSDFRKLAKPLRIDSGFTDTLRNLQYRDARWTKIPRALRFNDRISMRSSTELREPFLDHRLFELAMKQPAERKIKHGTGKWLLRRIANKLVPRYVCESPKRALQTPQREWLKGPLRSWLYELTDEALTAYGGDWLDTAAVRSARTEYFDRPVENSFHLWQWISIGLMLRREAKVFASAVA